VKIGRFRAPNGSLRSRESRWIFLDNLRWAVRLSFLFFRFQWSIRATFRTGVVLSLVNSVFGLLSWFFIGNMFRAVQVASLENYDQDYLAFVLIGSFIATVFGAGGFFSPSSFFQRGIFSADFKRWSMSPTDPLLYNLVANRILDFAGYTLTSMVIQFIVIFGVFGLYLGVDFNIRFAMLPLVLLYLFYAAVVQLFYEMLLSSVFLHSYALRAVNQNVLAGLLTTISHIVSGRTFPIEVLPRWLLNLTWIFPQAQGFIGARFLLSSQEETLTLFWPHLVALTIQLVVYGALGSWLVSTGVAKVRREGLVQVPPA
jgi:ABC-2 type transport system permease protein